MLVNRYEAGVGEPYRALVRALAGKDHFVITTNVDHQFQLAGELRDRLFCTQGDYGLFQCSKPCCQRTYDNEGQVRKMAAFVEERVRRQRMAGVPGRLMDPSAPDELVPRCPVCGRPLTMNLRSDDSFVEDAGWHAAAARYRDFVRAYRTGRMLYLEIGVDLNMPSIIKYPFWQMAAANPQATYACVDPGGAYRPEGIASRSLLLEADAAQVVETLELRGALEGSHVNR